MVHHTTKNVIILFFVNFSQTAVFSSRHSRNSLLRTEYLTLRSRGRAGHLQEPHDLFPYTGFIEWHRIHWYSYRHFGRAGCLYLDSSSTPLWEPHMKHVLMRNYRRVNIDTALNYISILIYIIVLYFPLLCSVFCCVSCLLQVCVVWFWFWHVSYSVVYWQILNAKCVRMYVSICVCM